MATGRILKTQISVSEQINDLSLKSALLFTWMIPHADDFGRLHGSSRKIKSIVVPMRDDFTRDDVENSLQEIHNKGLIIRYQINGDIYIQFPSWEEHQKGLHRRTVSKIPEFQESDLMKKNNLHEIPGNSGKLREIPPSCARAELEQNRTEQELEQNGTEGECRGETQGIVEQARPPADGNPIQQIFNFWKSTMNHPNSALDDKRKRYIRNALKMGYSVAQLCDAITGCSLTPHNVGDNDRGQRYDGLHVILREADQIDRFMKNCHSPPRIFLSGEKQLQERVSVAKNWLSKKPIGQNNE